ncbi:MAG: amidohydrolase family protein [Streptosporangiales bacterium]|nr:amidohydrolase family protein [Streptosporangiales bacterium]
MAFDLVIRGGSVIDGTGGPARTADVAISGGTVAEVGKVSGTGKREIDAGGAVVTPGFVDIHTHYDGQATWDSRLNPSSDHGVTTVVMGNCGVGFAPVRPPDHGKLIELMEGVEDLPGAVLSEGLSWDWESIPEYLDALERRPHDLDFAAQVCHGPIRLFVMGERGADREPATAEEIAEMGRLAAEGIRAGALGFTTSRTLNHRTASGAPAPTVRAERAELVGIAEAVGATGIGVLQVVSDFEDVADEIATLLAMMRTSGRPLSVSLLQGRSGTGYRKILDTLSRANAEGLEMRAQVAARMVGILVGLEGTVNPLRGSATYRSLEGLDLAKRAVRLGEPDIRTRVLEELRARDGGIGLPLERVFELGDPPDYEPGPEASLAARAAALGVEPDALLYDMLRGDGGRALLLMPFLNYFDGNLDAAGDMLAHPHTVPGLGDGGAHVGTICDASFTTTLLTHWARDRRQGTRFDLPFLIRRQCRGTAETVGLLDRGLLAPGYKADVNVIDFDGLRLHPPAMAHDLPAGGKRLLQTASGYLHTIVSGTEVYAGGEPTGELPGRLVRGARPDPATA